VKLLFFLFIKSRAFLITNQDNFIQQCMLFPAHHVLKQKSKRINNQSACKVPRKFILLPFKTKSLLMKPIFIALIFVAAVACTSQLYVPTEKNVNKVEQASLSELQLGHDLYVNNCGKCHKLHNPSSRSNVDWKRALNEMAPKAKLDNEQSYLIYRYLVNR